ncbi:MAG: beta strand repeat-containing protein [Gemmatimonadales bacterium]
MARGIAWRTQFPAAYQQAGAAAAGIVAFTKVRVLLHHSDGTVAIDTVVDFGANVDSLPLTLDVKLLPSAPATGEPLSLNLAYINATGDTVFKGGPVSVMAVPTTAIGTTPTAPVTIPVAYTGPGAAAVGVQISPRTGTASSGNSFTFTAVAVDGNGNPVANTPVFWSSLDIAAATLPRADSGRALAVGSTRTTARIVAQLLTGSATDQVILNVQPPATTVVIQAGSGQSGTIGTALASPLVVYATAADGGPVSGVTVTFSVTAGGGSVANTVVTNAAGLAQATWTLGSTIGAQTVSAAAGSLSGSPLTFTATASAPPHLLVTTSPGTAQVAGVTVTPGFVVSAYDANNNPDPTFTGTVTLAIGTNPGGATLSGTTSVSAVSGVATFSAFSLNKAGTGYTVVASAAGYVNGTSAAFNVAAGAATTIAINGGNNQAGPANTVLAQPLSAIVTDAGGNPVAGVTVHFAVTGGGGSVGTAAPVTNAAGVATTTWTVGPAGAQSVGAAALDVLGKPLAGSPLVFTANGTGAVASTTVAPQTAAILSLGDVTTLTATSHDASNNVVAGTYGWVSRKPAVATVSATTGVVTGVTNGTAYVVATEVGGTKDSALVTVAQSVATINVTPNTRTIYLTGTYTFTAQAVDGRGNALAAQPTFTWSSSAPAIANVNSATGLATALSLGPVQIKATAGTITGVANVSILSAIQHIYVVRDSAGFAPTASDTFNMAALQLHRAYKAFAYDTLNNPVNGLTFTWVTTNPSVAAIDTTAALRADAISLANGNASIQASVQGVTGSALLNVQQVLTAIAITPVSPTIAVGGSVALTARGKDSNGQFIAGGTFTWISSDPTKVTVINSTGVATGVAIGTSNITATSSSITSATPDVVTVSASVPPVISFGRDTVSVGRGSSTQVPILLSTPSATPVVVNLAVADTFAFWSSASVTIPAGQTAVNAQLNGHNAGTTHVTATDAGSVYAAANAVLAVQATMRLTSGGYAVNATDQQTTQVLLSDPSPVGGTFVTFNYGTAGVASVSPSPAFIPAGQLAATIVITGVAAGTTTITPVAIGVNGTSSSFTTYAATLNYSTASIRLGTGQFDADEYAYLQTYTVNPLAITFTSSDSTIATVTASGTIATGSNVFRPVISAVSPGSVTITATAPGWTAAHMTVAVTTPRIRVCCGGPLNTTSPAQTYIVETEDSVGTVHDRTSSLVVHVSSSDPAVLTVLDSVVTIVPGIYYNNTPRIVPGGTGGTALLIATAGGHIADTASYTVVGPKLQFSWNSTNNVGLGQEDDNVYVYTPNNVVTPLTVALSGDTTITGFPATVTIPAGSNIAYFNVRGKAFGSVPIIANAAGYQGDTATYTVTTPKVKLFGGGSLNNFAPPTAFTVEAYDSVGSAHNRTTPLAVTFTSTNTSVVTVDPTVTIAGGIYYANTQQVTAVGTGTALIIATAPGHTADTLTYTVVTPQLNLAFSTFTIGALEHRLPTDFYAYTPNTRTTPLTVTLADNHPTVAGLSTTTVTINSGTNIGYFTFAGLAPGLDTVTATAPGYLPTIAYIRVTTPKLVGGGLPSSATTTNPPITVTVETADSLGSAHYASDTVVVHAVSSDPSVLQPTLAYFPILKNAYYAQPTINVVGPGTASITYSDSAGLGFLPITSNTMTVIGPSLSISSANFVLGNRQNTGPNGVYVYTPNPVATPLVVTLTSTDPSVAIPTVSTVTIPALSNIAYFQINALDAVPATVQIQATATGYGGVSTNVQVTVPKFVIFASATANTTSAPQSITVEAYDNGASPQAHYTNENVTVTLGSSASSVATTDSATVTIPAGSYYHNTSHWIPGVVGTSQLSASDPRLPSYHYSPATAGLTVNTPTLTLNSFNQLGIGQYSDNNFYVLAPDAASAPITVTLTHPGTVRTTTPASVTIPTSSTFAYFRVVGAVAGTDTLVASATSPVFNPATAFTIVGNGRIDPLQGWPGTSLHASTRDSVLITLYARDPGQNTRNVLAATTFALAPNANIQFVSGGVSSSVITSATIPANAQFVQFYVQAVSAGPGSATINATNYTTYVNSITVIP